MIELKRKIIALIESIPDERTDVLTKILATVCDLADENHQDEIFSRAEQDLALIEDIESLTREGGVDRG